MKNNNGPLKPEDYVEPNCVLCDKPLGTKPKQEFIPQKRIQEKLDELMGKKEFANAEVMLKNWMNEAKALNDNQGIFFIYNEMMGYYRKVKKQIEAYDVANKGMEMIAELKYDDSISGATCYTNAATVYTSFEDYNSALEIFEKAKLIYERHKDGNEYKLAGLYNNLSTCLTALNRFNEANDYYDKAIELLIGVENSELELAMIYLNKIDVIIAENGEDVIDDRIEDYLTIAKEYLESENLIRDTYYSFMADKCVGVFEYFGWFKYAKMLKERILDIDERARTS